MWSTPTNRDTGVIGESLAAGANFLSSTVIETTDRFADCEIALSAASAPAAGSTIAVYLLSSVDGTNYEDGGLSIDPERLHDGVFILAARTGSQKQTISIKLKPHKSKILLVSNVDVTVTGITLTLKSYDNE